MQDFEKLIDNTWTYLPILLGMCITGFVLGLLIGMIL
jgi:hypothetical protein